MNTKLLFALTLCSACAAEPATSLETGTADQDMISLNGVSLSGTSLAGNSASGTSLTGLEVTGVNIAGSSGTMAAAPVVAKSSTAPWAGAQLVGTTWTASTSGKGMPTTVKLRIDAATAGTAPNAEMWFYSVSYQTTTGWTPLCGLDASNQPIQAVAVAGVWGPQGPDAAAYSASTTQFTVACRAKTIAKCVELGYKPYKGFTNQLQACVRLLRADYCGTGTPNTVDGTTLNLYDNAGVQADTEAWLPEAEWGPSGATCINSNNNPRWMLVSSKAPSCAQRLATPTCGTSFSAGTLLIDELPPNEVAAQ
jgi:hypothetical protein